MIIFMILFIISAYVWLGTTILELYEPDANSAGNAVSIADTTAADKIKSAEKIDTGLLKAITTDEDTSHVVIKVSDKSGLDVPYEIDTDAGKNIRRVFTGRRINIAITGVDARLGSRYKHADANHVLSILIDSAKIEIISVPRDTEADAGLPDSSGQNKLAVVRAAKGRAFYLKELARIARVDRIHYYVEVGFSQAMGILEWLGFKKSGSTLQVLRSRSGFAGNDFQRHYNQAQFIRQMLLKHFDEFAGFWGEVLIRGGLAMVETNLTAEKLNEIISSLKKNGFPKSKDDISVCIRPPMAIRYKLFDFTDHEAVRDLSNRIEGFNTKIIKKRDSTYITPNKRAENILISAIEKSRLDSAKNPTLVINKLHTLFNQRAWLQISDLAVRAEIRDEIGELLFDAYTKKKQFNKASKVSRVIMAEKNLFKYSQSGDEPDNIKRDIKKDMKRDMTPDSADTLNAVSIPKYE